MAFWCGVCGFACRWFGELLAGKGSHALPSVVIRQSAEDCSPEVVVTGGSVGGFPWFPSGIGARIFVGVGLYAGWCCGEFWDSRPLTRTYDEPTIFDELEDVQLSRRRPGFGSVPVSRDLRILDGSSSCDNPSRFAAEVVRRLRNCK